MKMNPTRWLPGTALIVFMLTFSPSLLADEGMWLFNHPPHKQLKEKYGFDVTEAWLDHVQTLQQRRLRFLCLRGRPGDIESSRRRRRPAKVR